MITPDELRELANELDVIRVTRHPELMSACARACARILELQEQGHGVLLDSLSDIIREELERAE